MKDIRDDLAACRLCAERFAVTATQHRPRPIVWFKPGARLLIASQAPGKRVHEAGKPFWDMSGTRLRDWLGLDEATFYDRDRVAIVPMGFCFPGYDAKGGDLPPRTECAPLWRGQIFDAMPQVELILVIGQYAQAWHMGAERRKTLTETVRNWRAVFETEQVPAILPLPHPSWRNTGWLKKNAWFDEEVLPVLRSEVKRLTTLK